MTTEAGGLTNTPMLEQVFVNPDHSSQVLYQLSELWRDKKLCDATIEVGPVKVYVHRLVLLAACPYLLTVGGQHEVSILEVKLPMTVGLEGLNIFLTYLYDGVLHLTSANLRSVEKLTKILKVTSIQKFCQEFRETNKETGTADKITTDYSLKMTNSSLQIIFSEIQSEMKRECAESETETTPSKRPRMNLDKLSAALQKKSEAGKDNCRGHSVTNVASSGPSEDQHDNRDIGATDPLMMQVKEEPMSDYDDEDDTSYSEDTSESQSYSGTTDFVRQAPYDTRPFPDDEESVGRGNKMVVALPPPPSLQKRPSVKRKSFHSSGQHTSQTSETDPDGVSEDMNSGDLGAAGEGGVDATKVLKNIVKSMPEMAMNLGTSSEIGEDNKPSFGNEDWAMYMVRPQAQKKKTRMELPLEKKIELIREYKTSPKPRQKAFAMKYGLGRSTVSDILKKSDFYMKQYEENADLNKRRFHNSCKFEQLNRFMWSWYLEARARGIPVSGTLIQERSLRYAHELRMPDFKASNGWLQSWKSRYSIKSFKVSNSDNVRSRVDYLPNNPQDDSSRIEVVPHVLDMPATGMAPPMPPGVTSGMSPGAQDSSKIGLMPSNLLYSESPAFPDRESRENKPTYSGQEERVPVEKPETDMISDEEEDDTNDVDTEESEPGSPENETMKQEMTNKEYSMSEKNTDQPVRGDYPSTSSASYQQPASSNYIPEHGKGYQSQYKDYHTGSSTDYHISPGEFDLHAKEYLDNQNEHLQPQNTDFHMHTSFGAQGKTYNLGAPGDTQSHHFKVQASGFDGPQQQQQQPSSSMVYGTPNPANYPTSSPQFSLQPTEFEPQPKDPM